MPAYEYKCRCGHYEQIYQQMEDDHIAVCPRCHNSMQRVFAPVTFRFSGKPRWYDPLRGIQDAEYDRKAHLKIKEAEGKL